MTPTDPLSEDDFAQLVRRAIALTDAPPALVHRAIGLWPATSTPSLQSAAQSLLRHIAAVLSFDSWAEPAAAMGTRSASSTTRHLLFSALDRDIDLRVTPEAGGFTVTGQILGPDGSGRVELHAEPESDRTSPLHATALDDMGGFQLEGVAPGRYVLRLNMGDDQIVLPALDVGEPTR